MASTVEKSQKLTKEIFLIMKTIPIGCLWLNKKIQCNLNLVTLNLVTTFDLVTLCALVKVFSLTERVTKSRLHFTSYHFTLRFFASLPHI